MVGHMLGRDPHMLVNPGYLDEPTIRADLTAIDVVQSAEALVTACVPPVLRWRNAVALQIYAHLFQDCGRRRN